jgi:hypothetical protein
VRIDGRRAFEIDVAAYNNAGEMVMAIEVKGGMYRTTLGAMSSLATRLFDMTPIRNACIAIGQTYRLYDRDGQSKPIDKLPSPTNFGISMVSGSGEVRAASQRTRMPRTCEDLEAILDGDCPRSVLLDFTLPWRDRVPASSPLQKLNPDSNSNQQLGIRDSIQLLIACDLPRLLYQFLC